MTHWTGSSRKKDKKERCGLRHHLGREQEAFEKVLEDSTNKRLALKSSEWGGVGERSEQVG